MNKQIDKLVWHDGNLTGMTIVTPKNAKEKTKILLDAILYENEAPTAKREKQISLEFNNVIRFTSTVNSVELAKNSGAGNISAVRFLYKEKIFLMNLFEGFIEIQFKRIKLLTKTIQRTEYRR